MLRSLAPSVSLRGSGCSAWPLAMKESGHDGHGHGVQSARGKMTKNNKTSSHSHLTSPGTGIGLLESHLHEIFAFDRIPSDDYIYTPPVEYYNILEDYCDEQQFHVPRSPLLVLGSSGSGKSSLLANWLAKRSKAMTRNRITDEEYVFWHVVGCTRSSLSVRNMIKRLLLELKKRFEINRNISLDPSHYSWDLPRFLELASKKGKIILVIDGIHRFETIEGETNLSWLPLQYPPNVRVIISATNPAKSDQSSRQSHVLAELERRKLQVLEVKLLDVTTCRQLIETYARKTAEVENSQLVSSSYSSSSVFLTGCDSDSNNPITGLLMFETQLNDIIHHNLAANPLFLRLLLRATYWAVHRGYCLWTILEDLDSVDTLEKLYGMVLTLFEKGYRSTDEQVERAKQFCLEAGSLDGLKMLHQWHSAFDQSAQDQAAGTENVDIGSRPGGRHAPVIGNDMLGMDFHYTGNSSTLPNETVTRTTQIFNNSRGHRHGSISVHTHSLTHTTESQWKFASQQAEVKLETIRRDTLREMDSIARRAKELMVRDKIKYADAILRVQQELSDIVDLENEYSASLAVESRDQHSTGEHTLKSITESVTHESILDALQSVAKLSPALSPTHIKQLMNSSFSRQSSLMEKTEPSSRNSLHASGVNSPANSGRANSQRLLRVDSLDDQYSQTSESPKAIQIKRDPVEDLKLLPGYLVGGNEVHGFSTLLGNALCLLYVARHGLKESELWSILSTLPHGDNPPAASKLKFAPIHLTSELKALIGVCYHYREEFSRVWKSNDILHTGKLTKGKLLVGMQRVNQEFTPSDLENLLTILDCHPVQNCSTVSSFKNFKTVSYPVLLERLIRAHRLIKLKKKLVEGQLKSTDDDLSLENDPLFDSLHLGDEIDISELSQDTLSTKSGQTTSEKSLGPILEEALLTALCSLGILHSPKNQVVILPCDQELFRNVILDRYITAKGGTVEDWHMKLIRFFEKKQNSHRRCEELPWHLKICRRWYSLKADVSHLDTFQTMLSGELRSELLDYWYTLTHGALYVTDKAEEDGTTGDNRTALSDDQRILSQLDTALALHLTPKDIRKQLLKDCVANFDIVDELGQSVENWINQTLPSSAQIAEVIIQIAKFIAEFCSHYERSPPPFLRMGMNRLCFAQFNVPLDLHTEVTHQFQVVKDSSGDVNEHNASHVTIGANMMSLTKKEVNLYHYFRWMWIQFPWLAMPSVSTLPILPNAETETRKLNSLETPGHSTINLMSPVKVSKKGSQYGDVEDLTLDTSGLTSPIKKYPSTLSPEEIKRREIATRSWQAKKFDPSTGPVNNISSFRTTSLIKSSLTPISKLNAIEKYAQHNFEAFDISVEDTPVVSKNHQAINKYRCSLDVHLTSLEDIPFSQPSVRVLKKKTLFPSIVDMKKSEKNESATSNKLSQSKEKSEEYSLEEELAYLRCQEKLAALNKKGGSCIPCSTIEEAATELELQKTGRYRAAFDKVCELRKSKLTQLADLKSAFHSRQEVDNSLLATITSAESAMNLLQDRYLSLQSALSSVKNLNQGYSSLLSYLQVNPPASETHLESLEQEVKLAQQQCEDLGRYRYELYEEIDKIEKERIRALRNKITSYKTQRAQVSKQLKERKEEIAKLRNKHLSVEDLDLNENDDATPLQSGHRVTFSPPGRENSPSSTYQRPSMKSPSVKKSPEGHNTLEEENATKDESSKDPLEVKKLIDHLYEASGRNNPDDFVEAYRHALKLYENMRQHQSLAESRVSQLRAEEAELQNQLGETMFVATQDGQEPTTTTSERELRYLNQRLFKAEMRLNHNMRIADKAVLTINEVRTGVVHISTLLTCNDTLLQNLPNSNPPTLKSDGGIVKILGWCEERILAINEALVLDASKPVVSEEGKTLFARQADLAAAIHSMDRKQSESVIKPKKKYRMTRRESMSKNLLQANVEVEILPSSETGVRVASQFEAEKQYGEKCEEALKSDNARADLLERAQQNLSIDDPTQTIRKVVAAGITSQEASNALRRANKLSKRKQGRHAGFGWTVEELLRESSFASEGQSALAKKSSLRNQLTSQTPSRYELKQQSLARHRSHANHASDHQLSSSLTHLPSSVSEENLSKTIA